MLTKLPAYGVQVGSLVIKPEHPWEYHRGWPGAGFTHSLMFSIVIALLILWIFRSREWSLGLFIGTAAHALTDIFDSVGSMLFFPFSTQHCTVSMWAYAAQAGKYGDAAAYYGSLGLAWDLFWLLLVIFSFRVLRAQYFFDVVVPSDPAWIWVRKRLNLSSRTMLACYRAYFAYGACRIIAWTSWAHLIEKAPMDWGWNGPDWITKASVTPVSLEELVNNTVTGITGLLTVSWILWLAIGRRL